jgi:ATP-dependent DNA helicase RecG
MDLEALIEAGETSSVEFKRDMNDPELVEAVVCLANGHGGVILLGVHDDGMSGSDSLDHRGFRPRAGCVCARDGA